MVLLRPIEVFTAPPPPPGMSASPAWGEVSEDNCIRQDYLITSAIKQA